MQLLRDAMALQAEEIERLERRAQQATPLRQRRHPQPQSQLTSICNYKNANVRDRRAALRPETQLTRARIAPRTCPCNAWTISRSRFASGLAWFTRARRDLQAEGLNLSQPSRFIASKAVAKWRQIIIILYLCCDICYEEDIRRFRKTSATLWVCLLTIV